MDCYGDWITSGLAVLAFFYEVVSWYQSDQQIRSFSQLAVAVVSWLWFKLTGQVVPTSKTAAGNKKLLQNDLNRAALKTGTIRGRLPSIPSLKSMQLELQKV